MIYIIAAVVAAVVIIAGVKYSGNESAYSPSETVSVPDSIQPLAVTWKSYELKDVVTGNSFKISDYAGKPVVLTTFDTNCKLCLEQQNNMDSLKGKLPNTVLISLDVSTTEKEVALKDYLSRNSFIEWYTSFSTSSFTEKLVSEFGSEITKVEFAPIILICPDQKAKLLVSGVKSSTKLQTEIENC